MKIEYYIDKIVIYVIDRKVSDDIYDIKDLLFDVFNNLVNNYDIDIKNNYNINIYINNSYGVIVEMTKLEEDDINGVNSIGLNILFDKLFLYEMDDPLDYIGEEIYYYDNKYYLNANEVDARLIENSKLIYDNFVYKVLGRGVKI